MPAQNRRIPLGGAPRAPQHADVAAAASIALQRVRPLITAQFACIDVGITPNLVARMQEAVLTDLLEEMLTNAVHAAPASRLLLTAHPQGDQIEIAVIDDMAGANAAYRQGQVRGLGERAALRGGSLQVTVHPAAGTTTTLRVLAATNSQLVESPAASSVTVKPTLAMEDGGP